MLAGVGCPCAAHLNASLKKIYTSPDDTIVRFSLYLQRPEKVENWSHLYLCLNISGKVFPLNYNSSVKMRQHGNYTAKLYDENHDGMINTGDVLEFQNHNGSFKQGDKALICVVGYSGNVPVPLWKGN